MQDLRVVGVEGGALLVASDEGKRFRIAINDSLRSALKGSTPDTVPSRRLPPREIQAHIRGGMSAEDVATVTGVPLDYIRKFEGAVLAEREHVVERALNVPVHTALETDPLGQGTTFGSAIRDRLRDLGAEDERWAGWKESSGGWIVKLSFTANDIDRDARWGFDPKKLALAPLNNEAIALSQQGDVAGALIPRLRAVTPDERPADQSRFDSGAFAVEPLLTGPQAASPHAERAGRAESSHPSVGAEASRTGMSQTADLLEALRRRRGEREAASFADDHADEPPAQPLGGPIRLVDIPLDGFNADEPSAPAPRVAQDSPTATPPKASRKGRAAMPSWDEIVFGARSDDDHLA